MLMEELIWQAPDLLASPSATVAVWPKKVIILGKSKQSSHTAAVLSRMGVEAACYDSTSNTLFSQSLLKSQVCNTIVLVHIPHKAFLSFLSSLAIYAVPIIFEWLPDFELSKEQESILPTILSMSDKIIVTNQSQAQILKRYTSRPIICLPWSLDHLLFDYYRPWPKPYDFPETYRKVALCVFAESFMSKNELIARLKTVYADTAFCVCDLEMQDIPLAQYLAHVDFCIIDVRCDYFLQAASFMDKTIITYDPQQSIDELIAMCAEAKRVALPLQQEKINQKNIYQNNMEYRLQNVFLKKNSEQFKNTISVIILMHNNAKIIGRCLSSLIFHLRTYLHEVIVVDNQSTDEGGLIVARDFPEATLLSNPINGCSRGRNMAVRESSGEYLAFFDSDMVFMSLLGVLQALETLSTHQTIGALSGHAGWFDEIDIKRRIFSEDCYGHSLNQLKIDSARFTIDVGFLGAGTLFMRRSLFNQLPGFDEAYDPVWFEDIDLSFQVKKLGFKLAYQPLAGIRHLPHQTTTQLTEGPHYYLQNEAYFYEKWRDYPEMFSTLIK